MPFIFVFNNMINSYNRNLQIKKPYIWNINHNFEENYILIVVMQMNTRINGIYSITTARFFYSQISIITIDHAIGYKYKWHLYSPIMAVWGDSLKDFGRTCMYLPYITMALTPCSVFLCSTTVSVVMEAAADIDATT